MRWTDRQIDSFDRNEQLQALNYSLNFLKRYEEKKRTLNITNQKIGELQQKTDQMGKGLSIIKLLAISFVAFIVLSLFIGYKAALPLVVVLLIAYIAADKVYLSKMRQNKAADFYSTNVPPLLQGKAAAEADINALCNSDDAYNARALLPDQYLSSDRVQVLMNLLYQRRARNISEAMMMYENMQHQQRLENIERERLKAAQDAAEAQRRAADAARNTEQLTRQMAREQKEQAKQLKRQQEQIAYNAARANSAPAEKKSKRRTKRCPSCKMEIDHEAYMCPYCHEKPPIWWYVG